MKKILLSLALVSLTVVVHGFIYEREFADSYVSTEITDRDVAIPDGVKNVDVDKTELKWRCEKILIPNYHREGPIKLKSGEMNFLNGKLHSSEFIIDMASIEVSNVEDLKKRTKLEKKLRSEKVFSADEFPISSFKSTSVVLKSKDLYVVSGNLTIKGITKPYEFELSIVDDNTAKAKLIIDRTEFSINYRAENLIEEIGDKVISNKITLEAKLKF
ncbi:YceI family protein [Ichthyobacterium seriolicida]|nr:YceI family protein [Ichthyobacterium seriolicida]